MTTTSTPGTVSTEPVTLPIDTLILEGTPRQTEDPEHIRRLAEVDGPLPPILVHRKTRRVIDGHHRVRAAVRRGERTIAARMFHGDLEEAFVHAVRANLTGVLRLSLPERRAAAQRIIGTYPRWSDRAIATTTGLAPSTVSAIRERIGQPATRLDARVGRDGRVRPVRIADARRLAAHLIRQRPDAPLRQIASAAGVSVGTAHDVRRRLRAGADPVPARIREAGPEREPTRGAGPAPERVRHAGRDGAHGPSGACGPHRADGHNDAHRPNDAHGPSGSNDTGRHRTAGTREPAALLAMLRSDPSVRYTERGRWLVRLLNAHLQPPGGWLRLVESVPPHNAEVLAELALGCARAWQEFAERVRARDDLCD